MEEIGKATKAIRAALEVRFAGPGSSPNVRRDDHRTRRQVGELVPSRAPARTCCTKTRALAAIWQKPEDFAAKDRDFQKAAQALKAAADSGDVNAIKASFADLGKTCKACHDTYRAEAPS